MSEESKKHTVDIYPLTKGKRMLAFLADFFLNFILTFVLFNAAAMPLSNLAFGANARDYRNNEAAKAQFEILYGNKIMYYDDDQTDKYYYTKNVETTLETYLSYYAFDEDDYLPAHPQYGHKTENEVLFHFYSDIRGRFSTYKKMIETFNESHEYFVITDDDIYLVPNVKYNMWLSYFSPSDMSEDGKLAQGHLQDFFINAYADVFTDIQKNDLSYNGQSYLKLKAIVDDCEKMYQIQIIVSVFIAFALSSIILYLVVPLVSKDNKTVAMMLMRVERIGTNNLFFLKKSENALLLIYNLVFNLPMVFFMPMTQVDFSYLFNITPLMSSLIIGFLAWIISFLVIMFTSFNQSLIDKLSRSVLISEADLDAIYRAKGYNV